MAPPLLSRKDANAALEVIDQSVRCHNLSDYLGVVENLKRLIGFDHAQCVYGDFNQYPKKKQDAFDAVCTFPDQWVEHYVLNDYILVDPVVREALTGAVPFYWADAFSRCETKEGIILGHEARSVGMRDGWMFAMAFGASPRLSCISLAGEKVEKTRRSVRILELVMPHLSEALKRVLQANGSRLPELTARETEILHWLAAGKTAWEISVILKISRRTVEFHTNNIVAKLDAANARHAIAIAAAEGIVRL